MAISPKRIYWDACSWIALIQREKIRDAKGKITENREAMCKAVLAEAERGRIEIVTSALSLVEVSKCKRGNKILPEDDIVAYLEHEFVLLSPLDWVVGERARGLMRTVTPTLKPPDAAHIATAALADVDAMHTFDDRLLKHDGSILKADGSGLRITKPDVGGKPLPLLQEIQRGTGPQQPRPQGQG